MDTLVLTRSEVRAILEMDLAVPAVEEAFAAHGRGEALMPVKVYLDLSTAYAGDFRAMPVYLGGVAGVKWVNSHPENPARHGLPSVRGMYILSDAATAEPLAVMDATWLTAARTGAAAAVASKHLARRPARSIGLVGCGVQAGPLLAAHRVVFEGLEVVAADLRPEAAERFAAEAGGRVGSVREAAGCDIVCTATPSHEPVVRNGWLRPGAHINAIGADAPGKQELEAEILTGARVVVDDYEQAGEAGEVNVPLSSGELDRSRIHASLGEVVAGLAAGRASEDEITVFDSTGLAVQDLVVARLVYETARERGLGRALDFMA